MLKEVLKFLFLGFLTGYIIFSLILWWSYMIVKDVYKLPKDVKNINEIRAPIYQSLNPFYYWINPGWYLIYYKPNP